MKGKIVVLVILLVIAVVSVLAALGFIYGPAEEANDEKFSVETTPMGRIIDTPCTRKLFTTKFGAGEMLESAHINAARHLTMRRLSSFPLAKLNDQKLKAIQAEFAKLDPRSAECQREQR